MNFAPKQYLRTAMVFAICVTMLTTQSIAQISRSEVTSDGFDKTSEARLMAPDPIVFGPGGDYPNGNPSCATLNALDKDPNFSHMEFDWEFKLNFTAPNSTFPIVNSISPETSVSGGMSPNAAYSITTFSSGNTMDSWSLNWSVPLDRLVSAVIVKGGNQALVYPYTSLSVGDGGPFTTGSQNEISHLTFCFEPFTGPTSAPVSIEGRALTMSGNGVSGARIEVMNLSTGEIMMATTNPFGYYAFKGISSAETYMITASHKRHQFIDSQRTVTLTEDLIGLDFVTAW